MSILPYDPELIEIRLANSPEEIKAAQSLRYKVFYEEYGATPCEETKKTKLDADKFDNIADHLIVLDTALPEGTDQMVGTYRLLRRDVAEKHGKFYTSDEYDIQPILDSRDNILELGRSCVLPNYRTRPVMQKLWQGIAHYVADHQIEMMFGCASFHGTDPSAFSDQLAYLYHYHLAEPDMCPRALDERYIDMNLHAKGDLDAKRVFVSMPPLLKGYIRLGASIGDGAVIDHQFNTTDVCIVMPTSQITDKYVNHYRRVTNKHISTDVPAGKEAS